MPIDFSNCPRHHLFTTALLLFASLTIPVHAFDIEKFLMPGELISGHAKFEGECTQCHKRFSKKSQSRLCLDCHSKVKDDVNSKKGFHGKIYQSNTECNDCHSDHKGRGADIINFDEDTFDHALTNFSLKGAHQQTDCVLCHDNSVLYRDTPGDCFSCHRDDDIHQEKLGKSCSDCHNESSWKKSSEAFDHSTTDFLLNGKHQEQACDSCHLNQNFKDTPKLCSSCHSVDDAHRGRYGQKCQDCHNESNWKKNHFDHKNNTGYPLTGKHKRLQCDSCHKGQLYNNKPENNCFSCHLHDDIHQGKNGPQCKACHNSSDWSEAEFDHANETGFTLQGKHTNVSCNACHSGALFDDKPGSTCVTCHSHDDVHKGQQGKACQNCHNESGWKNQVIFDHDLTRFPLIGLHTTTPCAECHLGATYKDASIDCYSCHKKDDSHKQTLGKDCAHCHNPNAWSLWLFGHNTQTEYELDGKHKGLSCSACHTQPLNSATKIPGTCYDCHSQDDVHNGTFGRNCSRCHTSDTFTEPVITQ